MTSYSLDKMMTDEPATAGDRILGLIKRRGPLRAADIAAVVGTTAEATRQQLVRLVENGLVEARIEKGGIDRPARYWHLTSAATPIPSSPFA
jgi:predicted ArsR family transcriptional regulator